MSKTCTILILEGDHPYRNRTFPFRGNDGVAFCLQTGAEHVDRIIDCLVKVDASGPSSLTLTPRFLPSVENSSGPEPVDVLITDVGPHPKTVARVLHDMFGPVFAEDEADSICLLEGEFEDPNSFPYEISTYVDRFEGEAQAVRLRAVGATVEVRKASRAAVAP